MKKLLMITTLVFLLCLTFGCQQAEEVAEEIGVEVAGLPDEDVAAIRTAHDDYVQAVMTGGYVTTIEYYTEDAIMMPPNAPMVQGREALKAFSEVFPPATAFNMTLEEIDGRDDLAFVRGTYSMTFTLEGAPEPIQDIGKFIEILKKQQDGSWLIAIDIFNSDLPLPE